MGWEVIGFGNIEFYGKISGKNKALVKKALKEMEAFSVEFYKNLSVSFQVSGNKILDFQYEQLTKLKDKLNRKGVKLRIDVNEFAEQEEGGLYLDDDNESEVS
jgi:hypothetical protein